MIRIGLLICAIIFFSCSNNTSESGIEIVKRGVESHGGYKNFKALESVSLTKTTRLYRENGTLESETFQKQSFKLKPNYSLRINWIDDRDDEVKIIHERNTVTKLVNNTKVVGQGATQNALKLALSAEYVFFQPFKLIDETSQLSFEGKQMIRDSIETSVVAVKYEGDSASSDAWRYYFDENYRLVAASVKHKNRISLIENLEFQSYNGILFNKVRKSYFVDSNFQKKQLRAEYLYEIDDTSSQD